MFTGHMVCIDTEVYVIETGIGCWTSEAGQLITAKLGLLKEVISELNFKGCIGRAYASEKKNIKHT